MLAIYHITISLNYHVSIFENMGVATNGPHPFSDIASRAPLVKMLRNHPLGVRGYPAKISSL